jgi:hypothetical protein
MGGTCRKNTHTHTQRERETYNLIILLHWLPGKARTDFKDLLLTYKALHGLTLTCSYLTLQFGPAVHTVDVRS